MSRIPTVKLFDGNSIPALGFGTYRIPNNEVQPAVEFALSAGYRCIDTASFYENEEGIGHALAACNIPRNELFITSKVWNTEQGYDQTLRAYERSLKRLKIDVLDLYLVHWPVAASYKETWRALLTLHEEKRVTSIGVSNFDIHHLKSLEDMHELRPAVNQVELHPLLIQEELRAFCKEQHIVIESWAPLMKGELDIPVLETLAKRYQKTPAQIVIRWHIEHGLVVIPKSTTPSRIRENLNVFDFSLSSDDVQAIDGLNKGFRFGPAPDSF